MFVSVPPGLIADLLIVAAVIYDWRARGRPHKVYVYGGLALLAEQLLLVPVAPHSYLDERRQIPRGTCGLR